MRGNKKCGAKIIINKQMLIGNNNCGDVMSSGSVKHPRAWGQYFKPYPFRSSERSGLQEEGTEYRPRFFGLSFGDGLNKYKKRATRALFLFDFNFFSMISDKLFLTFFVLLLIVS